MALFIVLVVSGVVLPNYSGCPGTKFGGKGFTVLGGRFRGLCSGVQGFWGWLGGHHFCKCKKSGKDGEPFGKEEGTSGGNHIG